MKNDVADGGANILHDLLYLSHIIEAVLCLTRPWQSLAVSMICRRYTSLGSSFR